MKRILSLLTVALLGAVTPVFADSAFDDPVFDGFSFNDIDPYTNQYWQGDGSGSYYTIRFNGSGTFYLASLRNSNFGEQNEFLTNERFGISHYGYIDSKNEIHKFDIHDPNNIVQITSEIDAGGITVTREGYLLGNFKAGDEIQIYLDGTFNGNDVWSATNSPQTGIYSSRFGGRQDMSNPTSMPIGQLFFSEDNSAEMNFGIIASGQSYVAGGGSGGAFGAPLPGGLQIALVAGLFGLGFWYVRRRKATVA